MMVTQSLSKCRKPLPVCETILIAVSVLLLPFFETAASFSTTPPGAGVVINEIMPANLNIISDEDGDYSDWIELYNYGSQSVSLDGWGLSDDYDRPFRWIFPAIVIQPGEYLLVWASGKDRRDPSHPLHTNFSISSEGEEVLLTEPGGTLASHISPVPVPGNISFGRIPGEAGELGYFKVPTPGYENHHESYAGITPPPSASLKPGFYPGIRTVEISHPDPLAVIRYTTDASVPGAMARLYEAPLKLEDLEGVPDIISGIRTNPPDVPSSIEWYPPANKTDKAHVIRAVAETPGYIPSKAATFTYFIGRDHPPLPVFSIATANDNLFDHYSGIYVPGAIYEQNGYGTGWYGQPNANYFQRGTGWERPASLEFFEDGERVLMQDIGVRIHGGGTRALPMKSLRLYARGSYGNTHMEHDFFKDQGVQSFKRLILRNSGQDFWGWGTMFRDGFMHKLVEPLGWDIQDYAPAILFLNGEYWGIHNIRERYDRHYFERRYGIEEGDLDFLESNREVRDGSADHYNYMISFAEENPLSAPDAYSHLQTLMDTDNYTDFFVVNIFFNNIDWPGHNLRYWRYSGETLNNPPHGLDGRWRWAFNDFDFGFANTGEPYPHNQNTLAYATDPDGGDWPPNPPWSTFLIRSLLENEEFRNGFINRFGDLMNSIFRPEYMVSELDRYATALEPEIMRHMERWGHPGTSMEEWYANIERMKRYADRRGYHQVSHIIDYFGLEGTYTLGIDVENGGGGTVKVNRLMLEAGGMFPEKEEMGFPWYGSYFMNIPVPLEAAPVPGYMFVKWKTQDGEEIFDNPYILDSDENITLTAVFASSDTFFPEPYILSDNVPFLFTEWEASEPAGSYPPHMAFVYTEEPEPGHDASIEGFTSGSYDIDSRTRINGHGCGGFSFINTSNIDGNPGYPGRRLGGVLLGLDTREAEDVHLMFHAATVNRNSRIYNLRLQYRLDDHSEFADFPSPDGEVVEYRCGYDGHSRRTGPLPLPEELHGQQYVQLLWRYYYTGEREDDDSGARSELRIGSIMVFEGSEVPDGFLLPEVSTAIDSDIVCDNDTVKVSAFFDHAGNNTIYSWYVDDMPVAGGSDNHLLIERPSDGTGVRVYVDDTDLCIPGLPAVSGVMVLDVREAPPRPSVTLADSTLESSSPTGNQWYSSETGIVEGADGQVFVPETGGSYFVVVNDGYCYSDPSDTVEIHITGIIAGPVTEAGGISVYPNPAGNILYVDAGLHEPEYRGWSIFNTAGTVVMSGMAAGGSDIIRIPLDHLYPGVYLLQIASGNSSMTIRFVKK